MKKIRRYLNHFKHHFHPDRSWLIPLGCILLVTLITASILFFINGEIKPAKLKNGRGDSLYIASNKNYSTTIGTKDGSSKIGFSVGESKVDFVLAGSDNVAPKKEGSTTVLFPSVLPSTDLKYTTTPNGVKEEIILSQKQDNHIFLFDLTLKNIVPKKFTNEFIDPTFRDNSGNYQFHFEKPFAVDASGARTNNVLMQIGEDKQLPGKYYVKLIVDPDWLNSDDRTYPISIDPTIVHDTTAEFAAGQLNRLKDTGSGSTPTLETYYQELPTDPYTVGLWHLNESSGNALDSSGNSLTGTPTGTTVVAGLMGNGRQFTTTSDIITSSTSTSLDLSATSNFTIEGWYYWTSAPGTQILAEKWTAVSGWTFYTRGATTGLEFVGTSASVNTVVVDSNSYTWPTNQWVHISMTKAGSVYNFYVNGQNIGTSINAGAIASSANALVLGKRYNGTSNTFIGTMDEVRISNIARTPEEIKASASRRPYSTYTSDVIDFSSSIVSWNPLTWTEAGVNTGDGETLKSTTSLVAQWNFNGTSGTSATNDAGSCSTSCNGTLSGFDSTASQDADPDSSWTANNKRWGAGALQFDGTDSYVDVGNNAALQITGNTLTVETWTKPTSNGEASGAIISKVDVGSPFGGYQIGYSATNNLNFFVGNSTTWQGVSSTVPYSPGQWYHVVGVYDSANSTIKLYVNGKLDNSASATGSIRNASNNLLIGKNGAGAIYYQGIIDSTRIYSRALDSREIMSNYQAGNIEFQTRVGSDTSPDDGSWEAWRPVTNETAIDSEDGPYQYNTTDSGLVSYWPMDETANNTCTGGTNDTCDKKGSNDAADSGGSLIVDGKYGKARHFDGSNDVLNIADTASLKNQDFTISAWINPSSVTGNHDIVVQDKTTQYANLYTNGSTLRFYSASLSPAGLTTSVTISTYTWTHVAVTKNGTTVKLYVNGVEASSTTMTGTINYSSNGWSISNDSVEQFNGLIDEVRMYSSALSGSTIQQQYVEGTTRPQTLHPLTDLTTKIEGSGSQKVETGRPLIDGSTVALWHLDETSGTGAYIKDSSPNANNGTPTGTTIVQGISSKGRSFNGSGDKIVIGDVLDFSGDFSIDAWVKNVASTGTTQAIVDKAGTAGSHGYQLVILNTGPANLTVINTANGNYLTASTTTNIVADNKWHHVAGTVSGTTISIYLDGTLQASNSTTTGTRVTNSPDSLTIGDRNSSSVLDFNGYIDEVRISNVARSAEEVAESYRSGRDHYIGKTISSTDLSGKSTLPFYVAADRPGSYLSATIGESLFANYQPDSSTLALWNFNEQSGSGAYLKDSSGNSLHGTPTGTSFVQAKISKGRSFAGSTDLVDLGSSSRFGGLTSFTISAWIYPVSVTGEHRIFDRGSAGNPNTILFYQSGTSLAILVNNTDSLSYAGLTANTWYHVAVVFSGSGGEEALYINGQKVATRTTTQASPTAGSINTRIGCIANWTACSSTYAYSGTIDEVRVDNVVRTATEIRQAYEIGQRTHPITIDFASAISHSDPLSNSSDLTFTLMATPSGTTNAGDNLFKGDKIIVKENYNGTEYIAQGTVDSVNVSTGATTVSSWDAGSTFPSIGYTPNASVFKWQREYWNINGEVQDSSLDAITNLTLRLTDGNEGRTIYLDDLRSNSDYLTTPTGSTITSATGNRYLQYRAILSSFDEAVSATLSAVTLDYVTNSSPVTPTLNAPTDTATNQLMSPVLQTTSTDSDSDYLRYKIQLCTNIAMSVGCQTFDQTSSQTGWSGQNAQTSTAYTSGTQATYTIQTPLTAGTTYYWRSYTIDPAGTNTWSGTQGTPFSFTTTSAPLAPTTPYAEGSSNPTGVIDTTPEFSAIHNDSNSDAANYYEIEVNTASDFSGTVMWDTGAVSMTNLASGARSTDVSYAGTSIPLDGAGTIYYWRIRFTDVNGAVGAWSATASFSMNLKPNTPFLNAPSDTAIDQAFLPVLQTTSSDTESDYLRYKIQLCTNISMTTGCQTFDQTSSQTGWSGQNAQTSTAYTSGTQATYTIQSNLVVATTYYWRSYTIDPGGSNTWSSTQAIPYSFTTLNVPETATACRIKETNDDSSFTIVWSDSSLVENGYSLERSVDGAAFSSLAPGLAANTTSYQDSTITTNHTYAYRVAPFFTGPILGDWCTTSTLTISKGTFKFENIKFQ